MKVMMLNWADYTIIAILVLSVFVSLVRGFVREVLSLITWIAAFWVAFTFYTELSGLLVNDVHSNSLRTIIACATLFIATLLLGALINYLIGQLVDKTGLSGTDRVMGIVFGFARGVLLVTVLLMLATLTPMPDDVWWKESVLIPQFKPIVAMLHGYMPQSIGGGRTPLTY